MKFKVMRTIGFTWLAGVGLLVLFAIVGTIAANGLRVGVGNILSWFSPYNVWNFMVMALLTSPGFGLLALADRWEDKAE